MTNENIEAANKLVKILEMKKTLPDKFSLGILYSTLKEIELCYNKDVVPNKKIKKEGVVKEKKKREPSLYNLFVKDQMALLKKSNPVLTYPEMMKMIGPIWQEQKNKKI